VPYLPLRAAAAGHVREVRLDQFANDDRIDDRMQQAIGPEYNSDMVGEAQACLGIPNEQSTTQSSKHHLLPGQQDTARFRNSRVAGQGQFLLYLGIDQYD
jgi:hypothetical protein